MLRYLNRLIGVLALAAFAAACAEGDPAAPGDSPSDTPEVSPEATQFSTTPTDPTGDGILGVELFQVCKFYAEGTGPDLEIRVQVDEDNDSGGTEFEHDFNVTLKGTGVVEEACQKVWVNGVGTDYVKITEVTDLSATYTTTVVREAFMNNVYVTDANMDGLIGYSGGVLLTLTNTLIPTGGGEGCTPGYWKNHAGTHSLSKGGQKKSSSWEGYSPTDDFEAVFGVAADVLAGATLIDAAAQGGGGEAALGRHAVAALLNAAHSGVSYDLTTDQVIALVQSAYASGDFESAKDTFGALNEQGCPL